MEIAKLNAVYTVETGDFERGADKVDRRLKENENQAKKTGDAIDGAMDQGSAGMQKAGISADKLGSKMKDLGSGMQAFGTYFTAAVTLPIVAGGATILKSGMEYESALNMFQAVTRSTGEQMQMVQKIAKDLGADLDLPATSAKDAALAMTELAKAGLTANDAMDAAKGVLQLAAAGQLEEAKAAEITANALNAFSLKGKDAIRVADLLAAAANASSSSVEDIASSLQQSGASFAAAKVPIEDLTAAISIMSNAGIKGSDAGTSLKTFLASITAPSTKGADAMKKLGVEVYDAQGKFKGMPQVIQDFTKAMEGFTDEAKINAIQEIFGSDASRAAQILFKDGVDGFNKMKDAVTQQGAAADLSKAMMQGLGGAWKAFGSQIETIGINIFEAIKDPLAGFLNNVADFTGQIGAWLQQLTPFGQQMIVLFAAIAAAIPPIVLILGVVVSAIGSVVTGITAIGSAVAAVGGVVPAIAILAGALAQIAIPAAIVAGWAVLIYEAWKTNFANIQGYVSVFITQMGEAFNSLKSVVMPAIETMIADVTAGFNQIKEWWAANGKEIEQAVSTVFAGIIRTVQTIMDTIRDLWKEHGDNITAIAKSAWELVKGVVTSGIQVIGGVIKMIAQIINGNWSGAWESFKGIVVSAIAGFDGIVKNIVILLFNAIKAALGVLLSAYNSFYEYSLNLGKAVIAGIVNAIISGHSQAISAIMDLGRSVIAAAKSVFIVQSPSKVMYEIGEYVVQGLTDAITDNAPKVGAALKGGISKQIKDFKKELADSMKELQITVGGYNQTAGIREEIAAAKLLTSAIDELLQKRRETGKNVGMPIVLSLDVVKAEIAGLDEFSKKLQGFTSLVEDLTKVDKTEVQKIMDLLSDPEATKAIEDRAKAMGKTVEQIHAMLDQKLLSARIAEMLKSVEADNQIQANPIVREGNGAPITGIAKPQLPEVDNSIPPPIKKPWDDFFGTLKNGFEKIKAQIPSFREVLGDVALDLPRQMADIWGNSLQNAEGSILKFFGNVALGFLNLVNQIVLEMARLAIIKGVTKLLSAALGGAASGGSGIGNLTDSTRNIGGSLGGNALSFAAEGGFVSQNQPTIIGERGWEMFLPKTSGTVVNQDQLLSALAGRSGFGSGSDRVAIHNHFHADPKTGKFSEPSAFQVSKSVSKKQAESIRRQ